jgi:hypothetical protein
MLVPVAIVRSFALFEAYNILRRPDWEGDLVVGVPDPEASEHPPRSFRGARSANPESIVPQNVSPDGFRVRYFVSPRNDG